MRVFVILASPNKNGHTMKSVLRLTEALGGEAEFFYCHQANIAPCSDCKACAKGDGCVIEDDFAKIEQGAKNADILLFAYPLYFEGMPSTLKVVIDRMQQHFAREMKKGKTKTGKGRAAVIISMGQQKGDIKPQDGIFTFASRVLGATYVGHAIVHNTDKTPDFSEIDMLAKKLENS